MKKLFKAFCMCFSMFCAIPTPFMHFWDESVRGIMLTMFPFVGLITGLLWALSGYIMEFIGCPHFLAAAIMALFPYIITGGIHLDGYMDCCDAIFSRRDIERRREILKDSHVGSFAVVGLGMLFMLQFSSFASAESFDGMFSLIFISMVSRSCSALGITMLRPMGHSEYSGTFRSSIGKKNIAVLAATLIASFVLGYVLLGINCLTACAFTALGYCLSVMYAYKQFEGFSGDVTGFGHTIGELCGIFSMIIFN